MPPADTTVAASPGSRDIGYAQTFGRSEGSGERAKALVLAGLDALLARHLMGPVCPMMPSPRHLATINPSICKAGSAARGVRCHGATATIAP